MMDDQIVYSLYFTPYLAPFPIISLVCATLKLSQPPLIHPFLPYVRTTAVGAAALKFYLRPIPLYARTTIGAAVPKFDLFPQVRSDSQLR